MKLRLEDEEILVGVSPEDFERRVRELLNESEAQNLSPVCERIVFWKGDLPPPVKVSTERLWFIGYFLAIIVFFYGLYSLGVQLIKLL